MRSSFKLTRIFDIDIRVHITFLLFLLFFFVTSGPNGVVLILGIFVCVTIHELCHSLAAMHFGIKVKKIMLLPIGGVASMSDEPGKPFQELVISLAGPMSNILILLIFYLPLRMLLGNDTLMYPLLAMTGKARFAGGFSVIAYIYWLNLVLAAFNMLPAFPMDGGRVLRALLSYRMSRRKATNIAVRLGHVFALFFAYIGIVHGNIFLLIIAVFVYTAASNEGLQVNVSETIRGYTIKDILPDDFISVSPETHLGQVLEFVLHSHQEDFPVMESGHLVGFLTKKDFIRGLHVKNSEAGVSEIMRTDIPAIRVNTPLHEVRKLMQLHGTGAMPVIAGDKVIGMITAGDIDRVYITANDLTEGI
ncbi:MAG: site-2 protease family protein [Candidatus Omnitrophica bacterium]|nr:site-2 protease family protein [Candidatus Omnitrophota bacterium]MBU1128637.1 site-2 protease family protein [Candidatus Omnitrophota bacterium]MBU1657031.1 site-2 protease family protein [Candidatus Omnitrophota bacterium]MBU1785018.1 site-2 protease family protein [Candidatus Omnitrophota bacterium]MBU1852233.1 site-2 protease family protein [Candidatus Omnitrophota bacterium]